MMKLFASFSGPICAEGPRRRVCGGGGHMCRGRDSSSCTPHSGLMCMHPTQPFRKDAQIVCLPDGFAFQRSVPEKAAPHLLDLFPLGMFLKRFRSSMPPSLVFIKN